VVPAIFGISILKNPKDKVSCSLPEVYISTNICYISAALFSFKIYVEKHVSKSSQSVLVCPSLMPSFLNSSRYAAVILQ